ncbi:UNVERIFIED_CONTAM: hypothetical protein Slati_3838600 [Sesamum latifolium]|uniref:Uncharacterized protein n=1 Tax=Sesamum latifolium TaxID=2727402 RepID=A0AAW2TLN4_9LAMI
MKIADQRGARYILEGGIGCRDDGGCPLIQFGRAERSGPKTSHNDTLVITALLANYEVDRIFIDSGSPQTYSSERRMTKFNYGTSPGKLNTSYMGSRGR